MNTKRFLCAALGAVCYFAFLQAQVRTEQTFEKGWKFTREDNAEFANPGYNDSKWQNVTVPHDWAIYGPFSINNDKQEMAITQDGQTEAMEHAGRTGGLPFVGTGWYRLNFDAPGFEKGKKATLIFDGAMSHARVYINGQEAGYWPYGYNSFYVDATPYLKPGEKNTLAVRLENENESSRWYPGAGLYRNVHLVVNEDAHIPTWGTQLTTPVVKDEFAKVNLKTKLDVPAGKAFEGYRIVTELKDKDGKVVAANEKKGAPFDDNVFEQDFVVTSPALWTPDTPHLYSAVSKVYEGNTLKDEYTTSFGIRSIEIIPNKGFFLNGKPYRLNGVNRHQDRAERASAFYPQDHDEDLDLMQEMGCNAVRLCHYPQAKYMHQQMDKRGLVAWAEIPFVNVYVNNPAYDENLRLQLKELILQNYNHPCILFWGLFNEINSGWLDRPSRMAAELHALARQLDPSRPTMGASNQDDDFNGFTDLIAFNKYFGWYGDNMDDMGRWIDREHAAHPERKMGISEYGAGACVFQQEDSLRHPEPWGQWHPENWQTYYHVENWKQLQEREFLWCNFIWCMFDFSAAGRREGSIMGRNDKGLVTYDRKIKKDAFYFYKANWNQEDKFVYIAGKRLVNRTRKTVDVQVFSNSGAAKLYINGKAYGTAKPDSVNVLEWKGIVLDTGENRIEVRNKYGADCCVWICPF